MVGHHAINKHIYWDPQCILSAIRYISLCPPLRLLILPALLLPSFFNVSFLIYHNRGFRNGVITGVRVRLPYIFQAAVYAVLFREGKYVKSAKIEGIMRREAEREKEREKERE